MGITVISAPNSYDAAPEPKAPLADEEKKETSAPENENSESKPVSESGTEHKEEKEEQSEDDSESQTDESESDEEEDSEGKEETEEKPQSKPKKKNGFKKRIDKLNSRLALERQQREALERQISELQKTPSKEKQVDTEKAQAADGKPKADTYETQEEYLEALADWKIEQRDKERETKQRQSELQTEQQRLHVEHAIRVKAFAEKQEDFFETLEDVDDIQVSPAVQAVLLSSENGPELMYELAKNAAEFARINTLSPLAAAKAIGRIEAQLTSEASTPKKVEPKKTTKAPNPIAPVGGAGKGQIAKSITDPNLSQADYERLRREQMRVGQRG